MHMNYLLNIKKNNNNTYGEMTAFNNFFLNKIMEN